MQTSKGTQAVRARGRRRTMQGTVMRTGLSKTVVVEIVRSQKHGLYQKAIRTKRRYLAHDENGECQVGDMVELSATRPLSKLKRWRVSRIVKKAV